MAVPRRLGAQIERRARPPTEAPVPPRLSVEEAARLYAGEWLLMQILSFTAGGDPADGVLLAHSPQRRAISKALAKQPVRRGDDAVLPYYIFHAPEEPLSAERFETAASRLMLARPARHGA